MNRKVTVFLTLLFCWLLQSNYIYAQDNFIEVIANESIKFSKEAQEKLNRVKNQKLYLEPQLVKFNDIDKVIKENKLEFVLPNYACKLSFTYQSGEYEDSNNYHWYGTLHNEKQKNCYDGSILFIKKDGKVIGTINIDESSYEFVEIENGYQILYRINPTEKAICGNENEKDTNPTKNKTKKEQPIDQNTIQRIECPELSKVRILVLYTPAGAASVTDINATTNLAAQQMRTALSNSQVSNNDLSIEIAAILPFSFTESNDIEKDVNNLAINSSAQSLRNTHQADLVVLMANSNYNDYAGYVKSIEQGFDNGYAVMLANRASSNNVFAHEVGHLLGGRHEVVNDPLGTIEHGYSFNPSFFPAPFSSSKYTLIAARASGRILHYSNPNVNYSGCPTGTTNKNNVAQHFKITGRQVAAYFPNSTSFYTSIIGSQTPCPWKDNWYEADVRCGTPPFTIQWHTSTNGVNYTYKATGEFYLFQAPMQNGTTTTIRMTVISGNNVVQTRYIQTTSYSPPNSFSCEGGSNGFRTEEESKVVAKVSPNPIEGSAKLFVELPKEDTQTQILVVDSFGKTVQTLDTSNFSQKGEFDITGLPTGLYYVSIRSQLNRLHSITIHVK